MLTALDAKVFVKLEIAITHRAFLEFHKTKVKPIFKVSNY